MFLFPFSVWYFWLCAYFWPSSSTVSQAIIDGFLPVTFFCNMALASRTASSPSGLYWSLGILWIWKYNILWLLFAKAWAIKIALANKPIALFPICNGLARTRFYVMYILWLKYDRCCDRCCTINLELLTAIACTSIFSPLKKWKSEQKHSPQNILWYLTIKVYHMLKNKCVLTRVKLHMYFYNVFLQRHFTYVNLRMVCVFTTFFTYGMSIYNVFLHMVCIFTTVFSDRVTFQRQRKSHAKITYVFLHMYFHICHFTHVFLYKKKSWRSRIELALRSFTTKNQKSSNLFSYKIYICILKRTLRESFFSQGDSLMIIFVTRL